MSFRRPLLACPFFLQSNLKFGRFVLALQILPQIAETYEDPNSKFQAERSSFLDSQSPCHIEFC